MNKNYFAPGVSLGEPSAVRWTEEDWKKEQHRQRIAEKSRPLTVEEVTSMLISRQVNTLAVDDNTALRMKGFYPTFQSILGQTVSEGFKFTHMDKLWKVIQPELTIQEHYAPGQGTESLYAEVCQTHDGTEDDPIPYEGNMELKAGLFYIQDDAIYRCIRGTGAAVYHSLRELVGLYAEQIV